MRKQLICGFAMCMAATGYTQAIKVSGTVKDATNKPIANAIVELLRAKQKDTTGADGKYSLNPSTNVFRHGYVHAPEVVTLQDGIFELTTLRAIPIRIDILDLKGTLLERMDWGTVSAGTYRWNVAERVRSRGVVVVNASVGRTRKAFTHVQAGHGVRTREVSTEYSSQAAPRLAKVAAVLDTLQFRAAGFISRKVAISSLDTTVDVTLEASTDIWGGLRNAPARSSGCGKAATLTSGKKTITSSGAQRAYIIDIPVNYDSNRPYRLFYASHGLGGRAEDVAGWNYFGLKTQATAAKEPAIFIAPQAVGQWGQSDHALFDDITALAKANLCVDTTRVFVTGMSFGGMITYSLSTNHQKRFRAGVALAPVNYNIWLPNPKRKDPVAWMQTTGMGDNTCPWDPDAGRTTRGAKYIALEKAADNGCTVPATIRTWTVGDPTRHVCVDLQGCKEGYPVKVCTFDGGHWQFPYDDGNGESLPKSWVPVESWKFFTQF